MFIEKSNTAHSILSISEELFRMLVISYLAFLLIDLLFPGFVSTYFDLDILLILAVASGAGLALLNPSHARKNAAHSWTEYLVSVAIGASSGLVIYFQIKDLGSLALIVSTLTGVVVTFVALLTLGESTKPNANY